MEIFQTAPNSGKPTPTDYPILSDLYELIGIRVQIFHSQKYQLYMRSCCRKFTGLHHVPGRGKPVLQSATRHHKLPLCGIRRQGLLQASKNVKNACCSTCCPLCRINFSTEGNTVASIDELQSVLDESDRHRVHPGSSLKRVRKKESSVILCQSESRGLRNPRYCRADEAAVFNPTHAFLFNAGNIDKQFYMDTLQLEESEYNLTPLSPARRMPVCGNERNIEPPCCPCPGV